MTDEVKTETKQALFSLSDLDVKSKSEKPFEFQYINEDGDETPIFFSVLGAQSEVVTKAVQKLLNDDRRKDAATKMKAKFGGNRNQLEFKMIEEDAEFGYRTAAVRLVGWRGIQEPFTPELAYALVKSNQHILLTIMQKSEDTANFTK